MQVIKKLSNLKWRKSRDGWAQTRMPIQMLMKQNRKNLNQCSTLSCLRSTKLLEDPLDLLDQVLIQGNNHQLDKPVDHRWMKLIDLYFLNFLTFLFKYKNQSYLNYHGFIEDYMNFITSTEMKFFYFYLWDIITYQKEEKSVFRIFDFVVSFKLWKYFLSLLNSTLNWS